ncbi:alcohol dehydrogenase catalytic domain-containing protein [Acidiphilium sp. PA]|uniref:zinc-dependent alcohol dehydrogenase n=1 Tax=Acidiphilium sp. PA TaxID=2871705 RepID=UPI002243AC12|nr:alcohol dehydrogenase catalytic domain-containing protein [Acidiphilium sp. PA]MCW8307957.1 alcohol dehydrogenase catalytic domain-containing protein [Acidiphilium sp. PA]
MQALFINGIRDISIGTAPEPDAGNARVPIAVAGVGVCGSDLHYYLEGGISSQTIAAPFVPGHEFAGHVLEDRPELGLRRGELVAVDPATPCGHCEWCHRGEINLCPNTVFMGAPPYPGAMAERIAVDPAQVIKVPQDFTVDETMMLEPLGVAIHAIDLAKPRLLESVAVIGCGPIGLLMIALARLSGVGKIYAVDPVAYRAEAAGIEGADMTGADRAEIAAWTNGRGVDLVLEATNAPTGFQHAAEAARIGGRIVLVGIPEGDSYTLVAGLARRKGLSVKFSRRMGHVYPRAIDLVAGKRLNVGRIVTHHFSLADGATAFELQAACADGALKSLIMPNR